MQCKIFESKKVKMLRSPGYNWDFDRETGFFMRWGETKEADPDMSPFGPEILDIEVSTVCNGIDGTPCRFCYKANTGKGDNMSLETFQTILDKMPRTLTQIAFGIGDIDSNLDLFDMFRYCRENDRNQVVPNLTVNGWNLTPEYASQIAELCGAVAVSRYKQYDVCYDAVKTFTDLGMKQVNIHMMVSDETIDDCMQVLDDVQNDPRLAKLNAVIFLMLKPKGRGKGYHKLSSSEQYGELIQTAFDRGIRIGFDSCSAGSFLRTVKDSPDYDKYEMMAEPCESGLFSSYINVDGVYVHCSFTEGEDGWNGIDVLGAEDFLRDVWYAEETVRFRKNLLETREPEVGCRACPIFDLSLACPKEILDEAVAEIED